jgi:hypothetical protein
MASDTSCGFTFAVRTPAQINLGPLANNGGPTQTMALVSPSSAIDSGDTATCASAPVNSIDQRGLSRLMDGDENGSTVCDIGAYEYCPDVDSDGLCNSDDPHDDGDGYTDVAEAGAPLCGNGINDDTFEDSVIDDGCPGGPLQAGSYSEGQFKIGTSSNEQCGSLGWPSDVFSGGAFPPSFNALTIGDIVSFITTGPPENLRRLDKNPGQPGFDSRWDLTPGRGGLGAFINIQDITTLLSGSQGNPPMFNNTRAFGKTCPGQP